MGREREERKLDWAGRPQSWRKAGGGQGGVNPGGAL